MKCLARLLAAVLCLAGVALAGSDSEQVLAKKGLVKVNSFYLLDVDAHLADRLREIRAAESQLAAYTRQHDAINSEIQHAVATLDELQRKQAEIDDQMKQNGKAAYASYNTLVDQHNEIARQLREGEAYLQRQTAEMSKLVSPNAPVSLIVSLANDMEAASARYAALASDDEIKKSIDAINAAGAHVKLGPSGLFVQQLPILRHQHDLNMKAAIKGTLFNGTLQINVSVNKLSTVPMIVDSGCSTLLLTAVAAREAGVQVKPGSPTVTATIANGEQIQEKTGVIDTLSVGQYTLKNVPCTVLPTGVGKDCLLGGTFLQHFLYQIDLNAAELRLTPVGSDVKTSAEPSAAESPTSRPASGPTASTTQPNGNDFQITIDATIDSREEFIISADGIALQHVKGKFPKVTVNGERWDTTTEKTFPARDALAALHQADISAGKTLTMSGRGTFAVSPQADGLHVQIVDGFAGTAEYSIKLSFPIKS